MANLRDIRKRITSVTSTRQITHTMEMVATAKIRRATDRIEAATPYAHSMREMLINVAAHASGSVHPLLAVHEQTKRAVVIAVTSDRGLAGGFNANVLKTADRIIKENQARGVQTSVVACGKRAIAFFNYRHITPILSFADLSADPTLDEARQIAHAVISAFTHEDAAQTVDEVVLVYNHARNAADQDLMVEQILPVDTSTFAQDEASLAPHASFNFEPDTDTVLARLLPQYVVTMVYHALLDSAAAEQGARRRAMKSATDSADEIISSLNIVYNRARQAAITTEITEIIGGAAALEE